MESMYHLLSHNSHGAMCGIATVVCPTVMLTYRGHVGWVTGEVIMQITY